MAKPQIPWHQRPRGGEDPMIDRKPYEKEPPDKPSPDNWRPNKKGTRVKKA